MYIAPKYDIAPLRTHLTDVHVSGMAFIFNQLAAARRKYLHTDINLTTVSKNTHVTSFLGSFQTPNPHIPPYSKYVRIIKINSKSIQPITKLGTINALRGLKRPQKTVVRLKVRIL